MKLLAPAAARSASTNCECSVGFVSGNLSISFARAALLAADGDPGVTYREELLLLELDPLPRRIREDRVETAVGEHLGKFQGPVEEGLEVRESASDSGEATIDGVTRHVVRQAAPS